MMGTLLHTGAYAGRFAKSSFPDVPARPAAAGCKGPACPAFAICRGRCATRRAEPRIAPDGGIWIDSP
jgi:hypothetical protein